MWQVCSRIGWYWSGLIKDIYICFLLSIFSNELKETMDFWPIGCAMLCYHVPRHPPTHKLTIIVVVSLYHSWESQPSMLTVWVVHLLFNKSAISPSNQKWPPETCSQKQPVYNTPEDMAFFRAGKSLSSKRHATLTDLPMFFYETSKSIQIFKWSCFHCVRYW